ncbi:LysE family translocator [Pseudomonas aeruginosa]|nr:LysE family translocator [Pseudomonas aeruginosa]
MQSLVPFLLFAVVASITPGPTNILVLSNSQRHGLAAAWPIVLGACAAVAALILLLGLGLGELLRRHPLLLGGAALQLVNPKAWMMALAALALFAGEGAGQAGRIGLLALLFFLVSLPCLASWALLGVGSARLLRSPSLMKRFNQGMALLLLASAWAALLL